MPDVHDLPDGLDAMLYNLPSLPAEDALTDPDWHECQGDSCTYPNCVFAQKVEFIAHPYDPSAHSSNAGIALLLRCYVPLRLERLLMRSYESH